MADDRGCTEASDYMRALVFTLAVLLAATACEPPKKPASTKPKEDTSDETVLQFHTVGQLKYGTWYQAPDANKACRWRVEWKPAGDDVKPAVLESGTNEDAVRVRAEIAGKDVYLRFNKACGQFEEVR